MGLIRRRSESKFTSELMNSNWHLNSVLTETEIEPVGPGPCIRGKTQVH